MTGFSDTALEQFVQWEEDDKKIFRKIGRLIKEIRRDPFHGTGKPEPLKGNWSGHWSRRITEEHRLVYQQPSVVVLVRYLSQRTYLRYVRFAYNQVLPDQVVIISCKYHYQ